ncbi:ANTAR domain-containing protein [Candidatus Dojkabacteria bacterium]|uniref:ANTAR domain-containing protein n=1 Tax=Candidatus Dojkabacteria bacterium TaxID=2099670 RepID=A0A955L915_9BACT|nr:ANTAR domain-containing protein [Candidatus Dojkabacteria bacterium]
MSAQSSHELLDIIAPLARLSSQSYKFDEFVEEVLTLINKIVVADSCFIYLFEPKSQELILRGSKIKKKRELGEVRMHLGEGITGWVAKHLESVVLKNEAFKDPRFKTFNQLPEDEFHAFASIPIILKGHIVGVINLQNKEPYNFPREEISLLEAIAQIFASGFEQFTLRTKVTELENKLEDRKLIEKAKGVMMAKMGISESEAYKLMRSEAMKKRKSLKELAEAAIMLWG